MKHPTVPFAPSIRTASDDLRFVAMRLAEEDCQIGMGRFATVAIAFNIPGFGYGDDEIYDIEGLLSTYASDVPAPKRQALLTVKILVLLFAAIALDERYR